MFLNIKWVNITGLILLVPVFITGCLESQENRLPAREWNPRELQRIAYHNPAITVDLGVGLWALPLPMDYDQDGDLDLVVSCPDYPFNGIYFFENKDGQVEKPVFEPPVRIGDQERNIEISYFAGEPHVLIPGQEITGLGSGQFVKTDIYPVEAILKDFPKHEPRFHQWKYVDWEGDGDKDTLVGADDWGDYG